MSAAGAARPAATTGQNRPATEGRSGQDATAEAAAPVAYGAYGAAAPAEPLAVIGLSCRFPGDAESPDAFWRLLQRGGHGIRDGAERFAQAAEAGPDFEAVVESTTSRGGFLPDIAGFDPEFFGISRREAELMDPQQRLLLELAWEALEHAGVVPATLAGGGCGVFVGVGSDDYGRQLLEDLPGIEPWTGIGAALCATANRVSHSLDLRGPSLAVDTACSSSLVAVDLAARALRGGECTLALAAGVNLIAGPGLSVTLDRAGAIAPDGRSKSFDAAADGYGRGEGAGVLVLKRLGEARRDGDRVLAVLRGSGVSQDGRTEGIMAPSQEAQAELLRRVYAASGVDPADVDYVEAHGTGTLAGDPLEAGALGAVLGAGRPKERPCLVGSVKANIGHLEAGSGIAGMVKAVLALDRERIPPTPGVDGPNPRIPWADHGLRLTTEEVPWPRGPRVRRAGVSSFGYGGTIAHVILEEAPAPGAAPPEDGTRSPRLFPLSAGSEEALRADAGRLAVWLDGAGSRTPLASVGHTLAVRRTQLRHRLAVVAADRGELAVKLHGFAAGGDPYGSTLGVATARPAVSASTPPPPEPRAPGGSAVAGASAADPEGAVWVFAGHGAQWAGMGRGLLAERGPDGTGSVFASVIDELGPVFERELGTTPRQLIEDGEDSRVDLVQPLLYAVQLGLAAEWRAMGAQPSAVFGHSVGEIAAAVTAGVLSPADGARLVCRRSLLLRRVAGAGGMLMVGLPPEEALARLASPAPLVPAVLASPSSTVLAGDAAEIEATARKLGSDENLVVRRVASDVAFHSPHMDPLVDELSAAADDLEIHEPVIPLYGTALSDPRDPAPRDGAYWAANLRQPVRFADAVIAAAEDGHRAFLEISGHPVVTHSVEETLTHVGVPDRRVLGSLRRNQPEREQLLLNAAALHCHGATLDWPALHPGGTLAPLPTRSWRRQRYWRERTPRRAERGRHRPASRTLLGAPSTLAGATPLRLWRTQVDLATRPYPGSHSIQGVEVVPAAVLLQTLLDAAAPVPASAPAAPGDGNPVPPDGAGAARTLRDVTLSAPVTLDGPREVDVLAQDGVVRLLARPASPGGDERWLLCATGTTTPAAPAPHHGPGPGTHPATAATEAADPTDGTDPADRPSPADGTRPAGAEELPTDHVVQALASVGVPSMAFGWRVDRLLRLPDGLRAEVTVTGPEPPAPAGTGVRQPADGERPERGAPIGEPEPRPWTALFDAALSLAPAAHPGPARLRVASGVDRLWTAGEAPATAHIEARVTERDTVDVRVHTPDGKLAARFDGVRYATEDGGPRRTAPPERLLYQTDWLPWQPPSAEPAHNNQLLVLLGGDRDLAERLRARAGAAGHGCRVLPDPTDTTALTALLDTSEGPATVLLLPTGEPERSADAGELAHAAAWGLAHAAQTLAGRPDDGSRIWSLTRGVRSAAIMNSVSDSTRWGVGRIVAGEHPEIWGGTLDLEPHPTDADLDAVLATLPHATGEDVLAIRDGRPLGARLRRALPAPTGTADTSDTGTSNAEAPGVSATPERSPHNGTPEIGAVRQPLTCRPDGTYLITGGLGALGGEIARWLVERGARRLLLVSRRALPPRSTWDAPATGTDDAGRDAATRAAITTVRRLEALGATVRVVPLDIADPEAARAALDPDTLELPPVRGVVHAAGVLDDRLLDRVDPASLRAVLRPKALGALTLHRLYPPGSVDFLVHFSSCGQLMGLPGQTSYAAANAFLDALARHRAAEGDPGALSLGWTSWSGLGMGANAAVDAELSAHGVADVSPAEAFAAWERASTLDTSHLAVLRPVPLDAGGRRSPLLDALDTDAASDAEADGLELTGSQGQSGEPGVDATEIWALDGEELRARLLDETTRCVAAEMKLDPGELAPELSLNSVGLDSVLAIVIRRKLEQRLALKLPANLVWHRQTVAAIVDHLAGTAANDPPETGSPAQGTSGGTPTDPPSSETSGDTSGGTSSGPTEGTTEAGHTGL
ncbi:acyltransferase domain-containing protein [Streptomyces sp. AJS327]|uniref:type I polyketide synthase n=1 Tax=Streptomyces sp. AJS327 TaxID=2545265 RepID=UPI0015DEC6CF|nr:type I polyketide synthase [Streptomyces sp. AJS327]MBA0052922.1 acyltransferase domain-containing protein [Streptomyces sp. AJS327]